MVLESIVNPFNAEKKPWEMFFVGFLYSSIAMLLSMWIFEKYASLVMVFLTSLACAPLMYRTIRLEEKKDTEIDGEAKLLREHSKALTFLMFLFAGIVASCTIWYISVPSSWATSLFSIQAETITSINSKITGLSIDHFSILTKIFFNNVKVMIFCVLFAFVYGLGAIFILTWNASVIGVAMGNFARTHFSEYIGATGIVKLAGYFHIGGLSILRYSLHGIPEILAYFVGGLAGGIISVAVIRHDFGTKNFEKILLDSSDLMLISVGMLIFAALVEVFVTPIFF